MLDARRCIVLAVRARHQFAARRVSGQPAAGRCLSSCVGGAVVLLGGAALVERFGERPGLRLVGGVHRARTRCSATSAGSADGRTVHRPAVGARSCIGLAGAVVVLTAAYLLFRAPRDTRTLDVADEAQVRTMLRDFGDHDSLGYFATRRDKSVVWDTRRRRPRRAPGVSYRVVGSVSLASGNPVGDPEHWPAAIERVARARPGGNGWSLAVMGAGEEGAAAYAEAGLTALEIGDEAIVDLRDVLAQRPRHEGGPAVGVPAAAPRLHHAGDPARRRSTADDFAALERRGRRSGAATAATSAASRWRSAGSATRWTATACWSQAHDGDGQLRGFLSFVPWGRNGPVPRPDAARPDRRQRPGRADGRARWPSRPPTFGVGRVSLNFAMFREAFERGAEIGAGPIARLWRQAPAAGQPQLAAGVALPLQREVPARAGSRASCASSTPPTCRGSARPPAAPRAS